MLECPPLEIPSNNKYVCMTLAFIIPVTLMRCPMVFVAGCGFCTCGCLSSFLSTSPRPGIGWNLTVLYCRSSGISFCIPFSEVFSEVGCMVVATVGLFVLCVKVDHQGALEDVSWTGSSFFSFVNVRLKWNHHHPKINLAINFLEA